MVLYNENKKTVFSAPGEFPQQSRPVGIGKVTIEVYLSQP